MSEPEYQLNRLQKDHLTGIFDCGNSDLNDFLINDAIPHQNELLTVTYTLTVGNKIVAFFSLSNDLISQEDFISKSQYRKIIKNIPYPKRYKHLPAVKIGRLGVDSKYSGSGLGSQIVHMVKNSFTTNNKTGCRFITVDAYNNPQTLKFYLKNEFDFFTPQDENESTRAMYFDLIRIIIKKPDTGQNLSDAQHSGM
jgi:GNAT superfamily N-acetyltransferase